MSRYYIYDSHSDTVAEFSKKTLAELLTKPGLDKNGFMTRKLRGSALALGALGLGATGAAGYGGYKLMTRGKKKQEPAKPMTRKEQVLAKLRSKRDALGRDLAARKTSLKGNIQGRVDDMNAAILRSGLRGNATQGSTYARKQYNKLASKLPGRKKEQ
jgi:hypothetical protein